MKDTKFNSKYYNPLNIILSVIFYGIAPILLIYAIYKIIVTPYTETGLLQNAASKILFLTACILLLSLLLFGISGQLMGHLKGKKTVNKETKMIKDTNPYIYYRELPNNYGIGVTTLLSDSKIENYKDIVAVILDLCAKKYLTLNKENNKYIIKVLKDIDDGLLHNEKYIMSLIKENAIKDINYKEWFNYCLKDGNELGLWEKSQDSTNYSINIPTDSPDKFSEFSRKLGKICLIISIIVTLPISLIAFPYSILFGAMLFFIMYIPIIVPAYLIACIKGFAEIGKSTYHESYGIAMDNYIFKTKKGVTELQKLMSFQNFLTDFGHFVDKNPEEVVLWDRYLSYAQVFGLTKSIMKTGYKQLIDNSSFKIDDIDNITLYNIEYKQ